MANSQPNPPKGKGGDPLPTKIAYTPQDVVLQVSESALRIQPVPAKIVEQQPELAGKFELELRGCFKDTEGKPLQGAGLMLHTGTVGECAEVRKVARMILNALGADVVSNLMTMVERQIGARATIDAAAKKTILGAGGHDARCQLCGKVKPCGCISAKR